MFDRFTLAVAARCTVLLTVVSVIFGGALAFGQPPTSRPAGEPASRPAQFSHDELVKMIAKEPLAVEEYHSKAGKPLTEEQLADIEKANKLVESALQSRAKGDYAAAADASGKALATYKQILTGSNYRLVFAQVLSDTMAQIKSATPTDQKRLAEADKLEADATAAHEKGDYEAAAKEAQQALRIRESLLNKEHPDIGRTLRILGNAQIELGRLSEASDSLDRALKIMEVVYGPEHPQTALVLDRIGWLRISQRKTDDAVQALARGVRIMRTAEGEVPELAETLDNLGTALVNKGDQDRALKSKLRAYIIREKILGPDARDTGVSLSNLAWFYAQTGLGSPADILSLRKRAKTIFEKTLGLEHPWTSTESINLAHEYAAAGEYEEARKLCEQLVAKDQEHPDKLSDRVVDRLINLGGVYLAMGRVDDGMRTLDKAYELGKALYAKGDEQLALNQMDGLANLYWSWRLFEPAEKVSETVDTWSKKGDPKPDETMLGRLVRLGSIYRELGRLEDAKRVLNQAVTVADSFKGDDVVKGINPLLSLSLVYEKLGQLEDAERVAEQALRITESKQLKLARTSRAQAYTIMTMGRIQVKRNRTDIGQFSLEDARKIFERDENRRSDPTGLIIVLQELAACYLAQGDKAQAVELDRQALSQCRELAEKGKNVNMKAMLANAIKQLLTTLPDDSADAKKESGALKEELKQLLEDLRTNHALSAENEKWLKELGD